MKLTQLTMQAFGSYGKKTVIDFGKPSQNLFLITGDTGSGKTTIFDAIVFALYGEASSDRPNKKEGTDLQSQFVSQDVEPFVELTFSENQSEEERMYTVRRIPKHTRPLKRGQGMKEVGGSVALTMPDGTEYSQNKAETDRKLEEIVGLTKSQFMQVVMIAQGEFIELLRADSNKKKEIFRKLFNTELYQRIVNELDLRSKAKKTQIAQIRTACQTEAAHIRVTDAEADAKLASARKRILESDKLNTVDMECLLEELKNLCGRLERERDAAGAAYEQASRQRDERRDALNQAKTLLASFSQLEKAERELAECCQAEEEIHAAETLARDLANAYEIAAVAQRLRDARKAAEETESRLAEQEKMLPALIAADEDAAKRDAEAKNEQERQLAAYTKVAQRVSKALEILGRISEAQNMAEEKRAAAGKAAEAENSARSALHDFDEREKQWKNQMHELSEAGVLLTQWKAKMQEADGVSAEMDSALRLEHEVLAQRKKLDAARAEYGKIRGMYDEAQAELTEKQRAFLDAQAGYIAREKLFPGQPCPVCGSREHPHPCVLPRDHQRLTREMLDELSERVRELLNRQTAASTAAGSAAELLEEKEKNFLIAEENLREKMRRSIPDTDPEAELAQLCDALAAWKTELQAAGEPLQKNAQTLARVQRFLQDADGKRQSLTLALEKASGTRAKAGEDLAAAGAALEEIQNHRDFADEQTAKSALLAAETDKKRADASYLASHKAAAEAASSRERAETLIRRFHEELPGLKEEVNRREDAYRLCLAEKHLTEEQWTRLTAVHEKREADILREKIQRHKEKRASADGARAAALETIGDQTRPDMDKLTADRDASERRLQETKTEADRLADLFAVNRSAYDALAPKMEERSRITGEYTRIESLYTRLAGKVTGGRMDIETYVQRYYLQRVLYAANARFQEMSAGQFELRMVDEERAGEGKNRGLDLMVYSTVTGKEREVCTLSGGESFMAALSLALGMADQIREKSAAINLDMMFIDEGFGSLSSNARDQAVKVLQMMAGGSKMIGIISHVSELKLAIEDQLEVTKDETGSHTRWVLS